MTFVAQAGRRRILNRGGHSPHMICATCLALLLSSSLGCSRDARTNDPLAPHPALTSGRNYSVAAGEDYSLPTWVQRSPFTGYVNFPTGDDGQRSLTVTWAQLEPARGQYDWHLVDDALARASAGGYSIQLHILGNVHGSGTVSAAVIPDAVPTWIFTDLGLAENEVVTLGGRFALRVVPSWRSDLNAAFNEMIRALGAQGYPRDPHLGSAYICGISESQGEEFWLTDGEIYLLAQQAGFTPQAVSDWIESRFQAYADAFSGVTYKVAWVGLTWLYNVPAYADVSRQLYQDAWRLGFGTRCGSIEYYHSLINEPAFGASVDPNGYLLVDESIPPIATSRYFGEENEAYGDAWVGVFGSRDGEPQRYRFSMLRAMQERVRFLWTSSDAEQINPPLSSYTRFEFGKSASDAPDAWAYLSETPANTFFSQPGVLRNFERWLLQRDVPGGVTVPVDRVDREFNSGASADLASRYDYTARRTDVASGNPYICFDLDDRFQIRSPIQIKVEIHDASNATWVVEYANPKGGFSATPSFTGAADGAIKTVTFTINDAASQNALDNGMDFRIACHGPGDVAVRWVRVIRLDQPN